MNSTDTIKTNFDGVNFLAIGDIVTDAFIKLKDAEATCDLQQEHCKLCLRFGDKVPFESVQVIRAVGNSANAAVSASRLGVSSALMAVVGDDEEGKKDFDTLIKNNVSLAYMTIDKALPTNYHYVLWYDVERTILINHSPFVRHLHADLIPPKWIYLTSLGENTEAFHHEISEWLGAHPDVKLAFQPGTFQIKLGKEKLKDIYSRTNIFFCNVEEAQRILESKEEDRVRLMDNLNALGPKIVVITDGVKGAYARNEDGKHYFMPIYPHIPFERTGAGDAYSSTITAILCMGKTLEEALLFAPINAMSVTLEVGAQAGLISQEKIQEYLTKAPEDYKLKSID